MSTNIIALKAALQAEIDGLADALDKAEAQVALDRYASALTAQSEMEGGAVQSYTIAGRTVTRRTAETGVRLLAELRAQLYRYIRGSVAVVDMGGYA